MQSDAQNKQLANIQNKEVLQYSNQDSGSKHLQIHLDEQMKKSGVKASFERGQQSQQLLFESFKSRNLYDNESVDECETFTNDRRKKTMLESGDWNNQFDLQIKNQIKFPFSQQLNQTDTESNNAAIQSRSKKFETSGISSVIDETSSKGDEGNNFSQLNDSKKLNKSQHQGEVPNDEKNESKYNNNEERSPLPRNMLYSRRGSRRVPGMNASGVFGKESAVNTTNNHGKEPTENKANPLIGHKSGFFFAMKMKKYASHLVSKLQSRRYISLRARHLQFFNDKTILPNEETGVFKNSAHGEDQDEHELESSVNLKKRIVFMLKNVYQKFFSDKLKLHLHRLPMFQPSHTIKLLWDSINMISITYYLIFFPLRIAFGLDIHDSIASYFALGIIFFDILVYLNTGFYDKGALVTDRIGILIHYLDTRFLSDIFSMVPFIVYDIADPQANLFANPIKFIESLISLMFLVRVSHLGQIKKKIEERFYQNKTLTHIISLFTLLATTLYIAHLFSCIWIIVAEFKLDTQDTWMQYAKVSEDNWIVKYLYSLYFLIITMTTVGYGDIKPQNNLEHLFIIIIVLISSGVFSFSINKIGTIVQQMSSEKEKLKETLQVINNYMNKKNINMSLQQQIREYLEYYLKESIMNDNETEDKIIDMLSEPLKRSLMIEANKIALKDSPIFRNNFSESTISKTVSLIQELRCTPEEVLFYEGDIDNSAIFFVQQGKVELFIDSYKSTGEAVITSLKVFSKGSSFGETSFFTGAARGISIRSIDFTTLLMIKRQDFLNVVKESSEDYENYCKIRDKIMFYKNFDDLGIKCISCNNRNHFLNDCPYIHYVPDTEKIIKIHQLPTSNERLEKIPDKDVVHQTQKYNSLFYLYDIVNCVGEFLDNNKSYLDRQDWYDGNQEDEEEYEIYNQYDDEDEEEEEMKYLEGGVQDGNQHYFYKQQQQQQIALQNEQYIQQNSLTHPSPFKEDTYNPQQTLERLSYRKDDGQYLQNPQQIQGAGETHSHKSGYRQINNLEVDEKRERSASNLGLNELTLTPSGLVLNLINPNPGNIKENSQKVQNKKRSSSNSNLNNNIANPQILYKSATLNDEQGILAVQSSNYNLSASNVLPTPLLNAMANPNSINTNTNVSNPNSNNPNRDPNTFQIKQSSIARANSLVRRGTKRKNTEKTARSTHKRKSTKRTIDSKMNVQASTNSYVNERKTVKKLTMMRRGFQENQIQNTLLALQGMENILLQNKSNSNSNEFDVMKNFEIYFPHNNIDVVIFQLRKKNPHLYAKSKSFVKSQTKKLYGAMTMNSQHNRMSKMDIVLQKFLMSEMDDDKDKDSLVSATRQKSQTYNTHKTDHYKTPKASYANNDWQSRNTRINEKKRSLINSHNDVIELQGSPLQTKSKCRSMKTISHHFNTNQDANSRYQQNLQEDEVSEQQQMQHDEIYLEGQDRQQAIANQYYGGYQSSVISSKANSHNRIIAGEEISPKKNVSFQDNLESNLQI